MNKRAPSTAKTAESDIPRELQTIPPFPRVAQKVLQLAGKEDTDTAELVDLIRSDAVFGGRVLQLANSTEFGQYQEVDSLQRAVALVGHGQLRRIAVSVATAQFAEAAQGTAELRRCWLHTLACAFIAEEIAGSSGASSDEAYTVGLLHDIGCLATLARFPSQYSKMLREADAAGAAEDSSYLLDREAEAFGIDHCYYGAWIVTQWDLPVEFRAAAGRHHDRPDGEWTLQTILQLSSRLADGLGYDIVRSSRPFGFEDLRAALPGAVRDCFWVDEEAFLQEIEHRIAAQSGGDSDTEPEVETSLGELSAAVVAADAEEAALNEEQPAQEPQRESNSTLWLAAAIGVVLAVCLGVLLLLLR